MKSSYIYFVTVITLFLSFSSCSGLGHKKPSQETVEMVKSELAIMKSHLPIEGGFGMIITEIYYDDATNTVVYKYQYTISGVSAPNESKTKEAKKVALSILQSSPQTKKVLEDGVSFRYNYYSKTDKYLYSVEITSEDI